MTRQTTNSGCAAGVVRTTREDDMTQLNTRPGSDTTEHERLLTWVERIATLTQPDDVVWCDGSRREYGAMLDLMVESGTAHWLNPKKRPNCIVVRSDPADVARVEDRTFICSIHPDDAGPTNNWSDPVEMRGKLERLFRGSMRGRTMYVIPFSMGPHGSTLSHVGVQVTDSPYVVASMHLTTRVGKRALDQLGSDGAFDPCVHSVGYPLVDARGKRRDDVSWPCNAENKYITHFPETREVWSFGSGYGGNALLGKKCYALRIASVMARDGGWLAEHMLILKITSPQGQSKYFAAAFPSACGKTNLAMMNPTLPGWNVQTIGDDIAWMKFKPGDDGTMRLHAVNPEAGFFGVAPGTSYASNPNAMKTVERDCIFTNVAVTDDGDVWWEGMTPKDQSPRHLTDWRGRPWDRQTATGPAAHPNARFTASARQCPAMAPEWDDPAGVPISAILFGGRRGNVVPLVNEAFDWTHGTFLGSMMASEKTAAAVGNVGQLRYDPMAMLPFCGYNMADYWSHWLAVGRRGGRAMPRVFFVNWFRKDDRGRFLWPGFGDNSRVLAWIFARCEGDAPVRDTPIGRLPPPQAIDTRGLDVSPTALDTLLNVDETGWRAEAANVRAYYRQFGDRLPRELIEQLEALERRLDESR
jgi:phosphoenolpyruvate carboxykinase (GTP)